jgi:hypothetical protein
VTVTDLAARQQEMVDEFLDLLRLEGDGRGLLRGVIRDAGGRVVVSMAQEMLLQVP